MGVNKRALKASLAASAAALCLAGTAPARADDANPAPPPTVAAEIVQAPAAPASGQPISAAEIAQEPTLLQKILNAVAAAAGAVAILAVFSKRARRGLRRIFLGLAKAPRAAAQAAANPRKALSSLARFIRGILIRAGVIAAGAVGALFVAGEFIAAIADPFTVAIVGAGGLAGWAAWRGARRLGALAFGRDRRADTTASID